MKEIIVEALNQPKLTLSYNERVGSGLPIVLLHGSGFCKKVFEDQFTSKALKDRHLIAVDLPGHGGSSNSSDPRSTYSYAGFAQVINQFITNLGIKRCIIAGWSLGGQTAIEMLDSAPHVAGVLAFGAAPHHNGPLGLMRSMHFSQVLLLAGKGQHSLDEAMYFENQCTQGHGAGRYMESLLRVDPQMRPNVSRSILLKNDLSQYDRLHNSSTPVCLLHGENDGLIRTSFIESLNADCLYGASPTVFYGCGHAPFLEKQNWFDGLLEKFTSDVEQGKTRDLSENNYREEKIALAG